MLNRTKVPGVFQESLIAPGLDEAIAHAGIAKQQAVHTADSDKKTAVNNADGLLMASIITNLASFEIFIAGVIHGFNTIEAGTWKAYSDAEALAVKNWGHTMADATETFATAPIGAAVAFGHAEADAAKTAGDLIAAANKVWTHALANADKVFSATVATASRTLSDSLAAANKTKDIAEQIS